MQKQAYSSRIRRPTYLFQFGAEMSVLRAHFHFEIDHGQFGNRLHDDHFILQSPIRIFCRKLQFHHKLATSFIYVNTRFFFV